MRVFMLGWEFAPIKSGGLGVACRGIADGLNHDGVEVVFALPAYLNSEDRHEGNLKVVSLRDKIKTLKIKVDKNVMYSPYMGVSEGDDEVKQIWETKPGQASQIAKGKIYGDNLMFEVERFAEEAAELAKDHPHDVIHVHDWMTYQAGKRVKEVSGKPLIAHVHATEMDRTAGNPHPMIFSKEREGASHADHVIVVSELTKKMLVKYYNVPAGKISVVHNASVVHEHERRDLGMKSKFKKNDKVVLFLGRVTVQKGPEYFVEVAKKVTAVRDDVKFVMAGNGDMLPHIVNKIIEDGLKDKVICAGFLKGDDLERALYQSDLYIMPSVSEPFGISALEAVEFGIPVIMSKTSGATEVITNSLRAEFWDVEKMANQVMAVLDFPVLGKTLVDYSRHETKYLTWHQQAKKIRQIYHSLSG